MSQPDPQPEITLLGQDGTRFRYFAVRGENLPVHQIGWMLIVDETAPPLDPQAVSAGDIVGDLRTMSLGDDLQWLFEILRVHTQGMLDDLLSRGKRGDPADSGLNRRIEALRAELRAIPPSEG